MVAMAIIAGMVIPQFQTALEDAQRSATLGNLHELTIAIERYRMHHDGEPPDMLTGKSLPQLTSSTDQHGNVGAGPTYLFGPYILQAIPVNQLNGSSEVLPTTTVPPNDLNLQVGWIYDTDSGQIWAGESTIRGKSGA